MEPFIPSSCVHRFNGIWPASERGVLFVRRFVSRCCLGALLVLGTACSWSSSSVLLGDLLGERVVFFVWFRVVVAHLLRMFSFLFWYSL